MLDEAVGPGGFDLVVFDTTPAAHVTDAVVLTRYVHGAILAVRSFSTEREVAERCRDLITQARGRILGVVLNNVDVPHGAYGRYYYEQYYYSYGEGQKRRSHRRRARASLEPV